MTQGLEQVIAALEPLLQPRRIERMKSVLATRTDHVAFVFEQMVDPHNLSAVLRSLDAFSFQDVYLISPQARIGFSRKINQGTERWLTLNESDDLAGSVDTLHERGYRIIASSMGQAGAVSLTEIDFSERIALFFGNEHAGVSEAALHVADGYFNITMSGFVESLNLSVAAALCAHHARRELTRLAGGSDHPENFLLSERRRKEVYATWLRRSVRRADEILENLAERKGR